MVNPTPDRDPELEQLLKWYFNPWQPFRQSQAAIALEEKRKRRRVNKRANAVWLRAGRNQKCPCGSGVKFKKCHLPIVARYRHNLGAGQFLVFNRF